MTRCLKTPSAAGLLQMLPRQTNRTENGLLVCESPSGTVDGVEAIDEAFTAIPLCKRFDGIAEYCRNDGNLRGRGGE